MTHYKYVFAALAAIICICAKVYAADTEQKIVVNTNATIGTTRLYDVALSVKNASTGDIESTLDIKVRQKFVDRSEDGVTLMESSLDTASLRIGDQKLYVSPSTYTKLTVLLDRNYRISDILGSMGKDEQSTSTCINYSNLPVLFFMPDGQKEHTVGESWESVVSLPTSGESFKIINTLKGIETKDGENIAVVDQQILRADKLSSNASVESRYAVGDGKLLKSQVSCSVADTSDPKSKKNITIEISLSK